MFSKIERGVRRAMREHVIKLEEICIRMKRKCLPIDWQKNLLMQLRMGKNVTCATMLS